MSNCKNCDKPIEVKEGRRPREFCDNNQKCRNEFYRKNKKDKKFVTVPIEVWNKMTAEKEVKVQDSNKTTGEVKPPEQPTTNYTVNTKAKENDPKEGTMSFFNKFGCMYYSEIKK